MGFSGILHGTTYRTDQTMLPDWSMVERGAAILHGPDEWFAVLGLPSARGTCCNLTGLRSAVESVLDDRVCIGINPLVATAAGNPPVRDVAARRWLLIDLDAQRPDTKLMATADEHEAARRGALAVIDWLTARGWPAALVIDSGNGFHVLYRIELPNDEPARNLLGKLLAVLVERVTLTGCTIERGLHYANARTRLPGCWSCKGPNSTDRPWRQVAIVTCPEVVEVVTTEQLHELAGWTPADQAAQAEVQRRTCFAGRIPLEDQPRARAYAERALANINAAIRLAPVGTRDNLLYSSSIRMGELLESSGLFRAAVEGALYESACCCGLVESSGERVVRDHIRRGLDHGAKSPRTPPPRPESEPSRNGHHGAATGGSPPPEANGQPKPDPDPAPTPKPPPGFRWEPVDDTRFCATDYRPEWLVRNVLVARQPAILGGPSKVLKTSVVIDLALSLASGTPFLGRFAVEARRRTALLSGESGPYALQETARRIRTAKGLPPEGQGDLVLWQFVLPQLANGTQLELLEAGLMESAVEVVIVDPAYLCLLSGTAVAAENFFQVGPLLLRIAETCERIGCTLILLHHSRKGAGRENEPIELTDLSFAGFAEFARQWILISRREKFQLGSGVHRLWLSTGGSVGHCGQWGLDVDEGQLAEDFTGRRWDVKVLTIEEAIQSAGTDRLAAKSEATRRRDAEDESAFLTALDSLLEADKCTAVLYVRVRDLAGIPRARVSRSFESLIASRVVERVTIKIKAGQGAEREAVGVQRCHRVAENQSEQETFF